MSTQFDADDTIDLREVTDRVEELRSERDDFIADATGTDAPISYGELADAQGVAEAAWATENADAAEELAELEALLASLAGYGGDHQWEGTWYPRGLIRDSYFETAMDELLEDIGDLPRDLPGYLTVTVNYDALQQDYASVDFAGDTYWHR